MRIIAATLAAFLFAVVAPYDASANCADDAVDTCNKKHPDPNKSSDTYDKYELCIKAQLGQKCPQNSSEGKEVLSGLAEGKKGIAPTCPSGYQLKVDWKGKQDRCIQQSTSFQATSRRSTSPARGRSVR